MPTRTREGGELAARSKDLWNHINGTANQHNASEITVNNQTLQEYLNELTAFTIASQGFVTVGDGYDESTDLSIAFTEAFANQRLQTGGVVMVKSGRYALKNTVTVPNGITIFGEIGGVHIIGEMQNVPMFIFQETQIREYVIPPSTLRSIQAQDKNRMIGIVLYDNLNNTLFSGSPTMSTVPMIRCERGSDLSIDYCSFIGRVVNAASMTKRAVGYDTGTASSNSTVLRFSNSNVDGVLSSIEFNGTLGARDHLFVTCNEINTLGDNSGTSENTAIISFTNCNAIISDNILIGTWATFGTRTALYIKDTVVSDTNTSIIAEGNSGQVTGSTTNGSKFLRDDRSIVTTIKQFLSNTWGLVTDNINLNPQVFTNVNAGAEKLFVNDLYTERLAYDGYDIYVTNANANIGVTLTYPHNTNIRVFVNEELLSDYTFDINFVSGSIRPRSGQKLQITVHQYASGGMIKFLHLGTTDPGPLEPGFLGFDKAGNYPLTATASSIDTLSFTYDADTTFYNNDFKFGPFTYELLESDSPYTFDMSTYDHWCKNVTFDICSGGGGGGAGGSADGSLGGCGGGGGGSGVRQKMTYTMQNLLTILHDNAATPAYSIIAGLGVYGSGGATDNGGNGGSSSIRMFDGSVNNYFIFLPGGKGGLFANGSTAGGNGGKGFTGGGGGGGALGGDPIGTGNGGNGGSIGSFSSPPTVLSRDGSGSDGENGTAGLGGTGALSTIAALSPNLVSAGFFRAPFESVLISATSFGTGIGGVVGDLGGSVDGKGGGGGGHGHYITAAYTFTGSNGTSGANTSGRGGNGGTGWGAGGGGGGGGAAPSLAGGNGGNGSPGYGLMIIE